MTKLPNLSKNINIPFYFLITIIFTQCGHLDRKNVITDQNNNTINNEVNNKKSLQNRTNYTSISNSSNHDTINTNTNTNTNTDYEEKANVLLQDFNNHNLNDIKSLQYLIKHNLSKDLITIQQTEGNIIDYLIDTIKDDISNIKESTTRVYLGMVLNKHTYKFLQGCPKEGLLRITQTTDIKFLSILQRLCSLLGKPEGILYDCIKILNIIKSNDLDFFQTKFMSNRKLFKNLNLSENRLLLAYKLILTYIAKSCRLSNQVIIDNTKLISQIKIPNYFKINLVENGRLIIPNTGLLVGGDYLDKNKPYSFKGMDCSTTATYISNGYNGQHIYPWDIEYYWLLSTDKIAQSNMLYKTSLDKYLDKINMTQLYNSLLQEAKRANCIPEFQSKIDILNKKYKPIIPNLSSLKQGDILNYRWPSGTFRFGHSAVFIDQVKNKSDKVRIFENTENSEGLTFNQEELYKYKIDPKDNKKNYRLLTALRPRKSIETNTMKYTSKDNYSSYKKIIIFIYIALITSATFYLIKNFS